MNINEPNSAGDNQNSAEEAFAYHGIDERLSIWKLIFLGIITLALCSITPLSLFASVPLSVAILLYGRPRSILLMFSFFTLISFLAYQYPPIGYLPVVYLGAGLLGTLNAEVILRKWHPVKGILFFGMVIVILTFIFGLGLALFSEVPITVMMEEYVEVIFARLREQNQDIIAAGGEQARMLDDILSQPKEVANEALNWAPSMVFILTFFSLWACQFLILRNSILWKLRHAYPYSSKELVNFKVPDFFLYPLLSGLALIVAAQYLPEWARVVGQNVLYGVSVFYFFQGFGIYSKFLDFARIRGILRTFLVLFTISAAWRIILLVGILDTWVDFRGRFDKWKAKNSE